MNKDEVAHAFQMLIVMPLAPDETKKYLEMKTEVLRCLETIAKAGHLEKELEQGFENIKEIVKKPEFPVFLNEYLKSKKEGKDDTN